MSQKVEFFWDASSPYTYLAHLRLQELKKDIEFELVYRPFFLGGLFKATGNSMPASVPAKGQYMMKDLADESRHFGYAFQFNKAFPILSLAPMRAAVYADGEGLGESIADRLLTAYWAEGADLADPEVLAAELNKLGLDVQTVEKASASQEVKDKLRKNTEEAAARGAFGAPTIFLNTTDMFWGHDRMHLLEQRLRG